MEEPTIILGEGSQGLTFFFPQINGRYMQVYIFISLSIIIAILPLPFGIKNIMVVSSIGWVYLYICCLFLLADLILFLGSIIKY